MCFVIPMLVGCSNIWLFNYLDNINFHIRPIILSTHPTTHQLPSTIHNLSIQKSPIPDGMRDFLLAPFVQLINLLLSIPSGLWLTYFSGASTPQKAFVSPSSWIARTRNFASDSRVTTSSGQKNKSPSSIRQPSVSVSKNISSM